MDGGGGGGRRKGWGRGNGCTFCGENRRNHDLKSRAPTLARFILITPRTRFGVKFKVTEDDGGDDDDDDDGEEYNLQRGNCTMNF